MLKELLRNPVALFWAITLHLLLIILLILSSIFGWLFFGEAPWADLFPGAIFIVIGGLAVIWRERRLRSAAKG